MGKSGHILILNKAVSTFHFFFLECFHCLFLNNYFIFYQIVKVKHL